MLGLLRSGHFFGGVRAAYIISVIEYQERGLPHAHIVFQQEDHDEHIAAILGQLTAEWDANVDVAKGPKPTEDDAIGRYIDQHVSATIPDEATDPIAYALV